MHEDDRHHADPRGLAAQLVELMDMANQQGLFVAADYIHSHLANAGVMWAAPGATLDLSRSRMQRVQDVHHCQQPIACVLRGFHADVT